MRPDAQRWLRPPHPDEHKHIAEAPGLLPDIDADHAVEREALQRLRKDVAALSFELKFRQLLRKAGFNPDQPRVPAGNPDGGQWTSDGDNNSYVISDALPDPFVPGAQYAQNTQEKLPSHIPPGVDIEQNLKDAESHKFNFIWFYHQVRNKGPWDYKQLGEKYANFGNFKFGAAGKAAGFSEATLLRTAGWAQVQAGTSQPGWGTSVGLL
jgi:hypothetical protein